MIIYCVVVLGALAEWRINKNFVEMKLFSDNHRKMCTVHVNLSFIHQLSIKITFSVSRDIKGSA